MGVDDLEPICLGGLPILPLTRSQWADYILETGKAISAANRLPAYFIDVNGNVLARAAREPRFRDIVLAASGLNADGQPLVFMSRFLRRRLPERVVGTDLIHDIARRAQGTGARIYLLGSTEDVNRAAAETLRQLYPGLEICGRHNGYFTRQEEPMIVREIVSAKPDLVFVALGVPAEQEFVARNLEALRGVGALKTTGATFDYLTGQIARAPMWMQRAGLEWLFRLVTEPRRLIWRYAVTNPIALAVLLFRSRSHWRPPSQ